MVFKKYNKSSGKPQISEEEQQLALRKLRTPFRKDLEMYGKVIQLMGSNQVKIACEDAQDRICRIPGKLFKHVWLRANDIVIVKLWDFQPSKADVVWRYQGFQKTALEKRGELNKLYEHTHDDIPVAKEKEPILDAQEEMEDTEETEDNEYEDEDLDDEETEDEE